MRTTLILVMATVLGAPACNTAIGQSPFSGLFVPPLFLGTFAPDETFGALALNRLMEVLKSTTPELRVATPEKPRPRIVCGMQIMPGDASLDPGIVAPPRPGTERSHTRAIEPTLCR